MWNERDLAAMKGRDASRQKLFLGLRDAGLPTSHDELERYKAEAKRQKGAAPSSGPQSAAAPNISWTLDGWSASGINLTYLSFIIHTDQTNYHCGGAGGAKLIGCTPEGVLKKNGWMWKLQNNKVKWQRK